MSTWRGEHGQGAMRARREEKREQAEQRNAATLPENRSRKLRKDTGGAP